MVETGSDGDGWGWPDLPPPWERVLSVAALGAILALVYVVARLPHLDLGVGGAYAYPRHMDEWVHWGRTAAIVRQGTVAFTGPWSGTATAPPFYHEVGFHAYLATVHKVTGIGFQPIFDHGPALALVVVALGNYAIGQRFGYGHEAALLTALVPTSPRFLGPALLVPITFSFLLFVPGVLLCLRHRRWGAVGLVGLLAVALWTQHARAALFFLVPALLVAGHLARRRRRLAVGLATAVLVPLVLVVPVFLDSAIAQTLREPFLPIDRTIFDAFGVVTLGLFAAGAGWAIADRRDRDEPAILAVASLVALGLLVSRPFLGFDPAGLYDRAHMLFFFTAAPVAGYGLARLRRLGTRTAWPDLHAPMTAGVAALVAGLAVAGGVQGHLDQPYYRVIADEDWEAFAWIDEQLPADRDRILMEPWKALAFGAVSDRHVVEVQFPGDTVPPDALSLRVIAGGNVSLEELRDHGVEVIYTGGRSLDRPDLTRVRDGVYLVPPPDGG